MSTSPDAGWIAVVGWNEHLHYSDREPVWLKLPVRVNSDGLYAELPPYLFGIFCRLLAEYASSRCRLRADTGSLSRKLGARVTSVHLESLSHAGLIRIVASDALAARYHAASPRAIAKEESRSTTRAVSVASYEANGPSEDEHKVKGKSLDDVLPPPAPNGGEQLDAVARMQARITRELP